MAWTVAEGFNELKRRTNITDNQAATISASHNEIRRIVGNSFEVIEDFLQGSYKRETMLAPLCEADVDIFIVLHYQKHYVTDGQLLLNQVQRVLRQRYPRTKDIKPDGQAVTISFDDFDVDVVPAFKYNDGSYVIPDTGGRWINTNPLVHEKRSTYLNGVNGGNLVPFVKMVKAWNKHIGKPFRGFHLEVIIWEIFNGRLQVNDWQSAFLNFFQFGAEKIALQNQDPSGLNPDVGNYIIGPDEIRRSVNAFHDAMTIALQAVRFENTNQTSAAINCWRKLFGEYFPSYGY